MSLDLTRSRPALSRVLAAGLWLFAGLLVIAPAVAQAPDPRGWSPGTPAEAAMRVLGPLPETVTLDLPKDLMKQVTGPTLLVYFSPTCPHCQAAAPELEALSKRLAGRATVIGVASGHSDPLDVAGFNLTYGIDFPVIIDKSGDIASALGVRSTPSAVLVTPVGKAAQVVDFWYPYARGDDTLVLMRALPEPFSAFAPGEYAGNESCSACHAVEYDSWGLTHHSIAWSTLVGHGKTDDGECVGCHVTGNGKPTGWDGLPTTAPLVDVGCESCHGPGGPHDGAREDARASCAGCHDAGHSIAFDVDKGIPHIDHYAANGMSDEAFREARGKLIGGQVGRPMLAFQDAPNVGAQVCKTCHAAEYADWQASPHGKAMARLDGKKAEDPGCVRCHATPTTTTVLPADSQAFHTDESVGCESCHGPGGEHAKAGDPALIEGLGDDCPVCVVEALCTSCHTTEWDPTWDLDTKLPKVGHHGHVDPNVGVP